MTDTATLRVGTRGSALALWQADHVIARLRDARPDLEIERVVLSTLGDRVLDQSISRIGDKGIFTRELEDALRRGAIHLAVHSLKDLPTDDPEDLEIVAVLERGDRRDAVVSPRGFTLATLPIGAAVGTSSLRRRAQVLARRPDLTVRDLRGNVPTRIDKLQAGHSDAAVMAHAGLVRLGLTDHVTQVLENDEMLPAAGQGAVAVQGRRDDRALQDLAAILDHRETRLTTRAERSVLDTLGGGCLVPIAASATFEPSGLRLRALVASLDGRDVVADEVVVAITDDLSAAAAGASLAHRLLDKGAGAVLARARRAT